MADSWWEYIQGSPETEARDRAYEAYAMERAQADPAYQALRRMHNTGIYANGTNYDPRDLRMNMASDAFYPRMGTEAAADEKAGLDYALGMGQRLRDTGLRSVQEAYQGNWSDAGGLATRAVAAPFYPPASAGGPGQDDDWRPVARKNGVPEASILAVDWLTDPEMYVSAPLAGPAAYVVPAMPFAAARVGSKGLSKADDVLRAVGRAADAAAYGRGVPTSLVDDAGQVIRRLRNSPEAPRLRIEYK